MSPSNPYLDLNLQVLGTMKMPRMPSYYFAIVFCAAGIIFGFYCWGYQIARGVGVAGMMHPVMWGTYLINFVFWIEIGHAGSMMSALLYLLRAKWRSPIGRSAETMTLFAVAIAGLFPFIHLGRVWVVYWLVPYPNQREIWPNMQSPLMFDFFAAAGYFTVSLLFWYTGLIPDIAIVRDHAHGIRRKIYTLLALGWRNSTTQWRHYKTAYVIFAALTTAFVPCVASIVSWDYALTIVPGYHSTIYGPYFLAGAVLSGLAMLLTLIIPIRHFFRLENLMTPRVLESIAKIIVFTALLMIYTYAVEYFLAVYTGDPANVTVFNFRYTGPVGGKTWLSIITAMFLPLLLFSRRIRKSPPWLLGISILINIGMWYERFVIIAGPLMNEYVPYSWGVYTPSWVEWGLLWWSFSVFFFLFLGFMKVLPALSMTEMKEGLEPPRREDLPRSPSRWD